MTTAERLPGGPEPHVEIDPVLHAGVTERCFYALARAYRGGSGERTLTAATRDVDLAGLSYQGRYSEEALSAANLKIAERIDRCTTTAALVDFVIRFVGGLTILNVSSDLLDDDPALLAVDKAVRDHGVDPEMQQRPGQAAKTLRNCEIDLSRKARKEEMASGVRVDGDGVVLVDRPSDDDRKKQVRFDDLYDSELPLGAGEVFLIHAGSEEELLRNRHAVELLRGTYLPVLLERGQDQRRGRRPATRIKDLDLTAMWLLVTGRSSNAYAEDHKGERGKSASGLTRARKEMSAGVHVCVYVDDLLCAPRLEPDLRAGGQDPAQTDTEHSNAEEPLSWLLKITIGDQQDPRCSHLRRCLDVVDHVDETVLTGEEAQRLRIGAQAIATTETGGTRVDPDMLSLVALELDPATRKQYEAYKKQQLDPVKAQIRADIDSALNSLDGSTRIDRAVAAILSTRVSERSTMRAARLVADRNGLPDPSRANVYSVNPHDQAARLVDAAARKDPLAVQQASRLVRRYGSAAEREDPEKFLASLTDPGRAAHVTTRLELMIAKAQKAELDGIITAAVKRRTDQMTRDHFHTDDAQPAMIAALHEAEMLFAYWARVTFTPDEPLTFNCVVADPDHNPYPDRIAEIMS